MSDDLVKRLSFLADSIELGDKLRWGEDSAALRDAKDRIEELEAKLAQQDDLVQAAVAAALREAAEVAIIAYDEEAAYDNILDMITPDAQAALDRYVKERSDELVQAQQGARPIATAPRDGTHILVAPYGDPTDLQVSWFIDGEDRWANWSWSAEPSHWFPLPVIRKGGE